MRKNGKKLLSLALALVMVVGMLPAAAQANGTQFQFSYCDRNDQDYTYRARVTATNASGKVLWTYTTPKGPLAQLEAIEEMGLYNGLYYIKEYEGIVTLDPQTGAIVWKNYDTPAGSISFDFDEAGNLYLCGGLGPDFWWIDSSGRTVAMIQKLNDNYMWPCDLWYDSGRVMVKMEADRNVGPGSVLTVDLKTARSNYEPWKNAYIQFLKKETPIYDVFDDTRQEVYKLVDINGDAIPELWLDTRMTAAGAKVCTYADGTVKYVYIDGLSYVEGQNIFMDFGGRMDEYYHTVYSIDHGEFVELHHGNFGAEDNSKVQFDSDGNPIYQYFWDDRRVTSDEYDVYLDNACNGLDFSSPFDGAVWNSSLGRYTGNGLCTYDEIITEIQNYVAKQTASVSLPFYSGLGNKTNYISVDWGWDLFDGPSFTSKEYDTYDNRLAITALALSAAAEHSQEETKTLLTSVLGFEDYDHKNYDSSANQHPAVNFACKEIVVNGQTQYIFAIVVRGSSNLDDAWTDISSVWGGFDTAASHLHAQLGTFMGNTGLPDSDVPIGGGGRVKFFVTGHSLGGAVANIMAKNLSDIYGAENVFAYTFASPKVIPADKESGNSNIYNIINREDWVPTSPPNLKGRNGLPIGFSRHDFAGIEQKFAELTNGKSLNSLMKPSMLFWESHNQLWYPHAVETYMSFLLALSNDASIADRFAGGASHGLMGGGGWCPVDLDIYADTDKGPKLVGRIKDNVIDDSVTTGVVLRVDGDKKYFYFPLEGNYTIKLTGTGMDTMTYFVQEMDLETGEPIPETGTVFQNVSLTPGKQFSSEVQISQETITEIGTNLYVLDTTGQPEKEVLPDGKGTEIPYTPAAITFTDVPANSWYYDAVYWAVDKDIVSGTSPTTFTPNRTCTTTEIVTLLWHAAGRPASTAQLPFTLNARLGFAEGALRWAYEEGIIDAAFDQTAPCTRAGAAKFLWQAFGSPATAVANSFTDVPAGAGYAPAVAWAAGRGIIKGTSSTTFTPDTTCTRAEIVTLLYRAYK